MEQVRPVHAFYEDVRLEDHSDMLRLPHECEVPQDQCGESLVEARQVFFLERTSESDKRPCVVVLAPSVGARHLVQPPVELVTALLQCELLERRLATEQ